MRRVRLMLLAPLVAAAVLCAPVLASASTARFGAKQNGDTVEIVPGTRLKIVLGGASASTGYHWSLTQRPKRKALRVLIDGKLVNAGHCAAKQVGCAQRTVFVLRAPKNVSSTTKLRLVLLPPGRHATPVKTYTLKVVHIYVPVECQSEARQAC